MQSLKAGRSYKRKRWSKMAEMAGTVITDALKEIKAQAAESRVSALSVSAGIFYLNAMMASFSSMGVNIGYTYVSGTGDEITVKLSAIEPIVKNLALELQPVFNPAFSDAELFSQAEDGYKRLLEISFDIGSSAYPETLPIGSGNEYNYNYDRFYTADSPIITEHIATIAPETA